MKTRYLFVIAIIFTLLAVGGLRWNQQKASELTRRVVLADQSDGDVAAALRELRNFVLNHMNTSVRIELAASYNRAAAAALATTQADGDEQLLAAAQAECDKPGVSSVAQAECVRDFLEANRQPGSNPEPADLPEKSQYIYAFVSPLWSPDLAGLSLLVAAIAAVLSLVSLMRVRRRVEPSQFM